MSSSYEKHKTAENTTCDRTPFVEASECMSVIEEILKANDIIQQRYHSTIEEYMELLANFVTEFTNLNLRIDLRGSRARYGDDARLILLAEPSGSIDFCTEEECEEFLENWEDYTELAVVFDEALLIRYNPADVVTLGGTKYITGDFAVLEMDDNGNECSVNNETIKNFINFSCTNHTTITTEDGKSYGAFRIDD